MSSSDLPLAGVRVVETVDKADMCGRYLADLGATVIKVEPPDGSSTRRVGPFHLGRSLSFAVRNANKLGVALDLDRRDDIDHFWRLLGTADLWLESARPDDVRRSSPSVHEVRRKYPRLVVVSITDFGQTGPRRSAIGSPWVHTAMCGFLSRSGIGDAPPLMPPAALPAEAAALQASWAAVVGLWNAMERGVGDHIDLSLLEAAVQVVDPPMGMSGTAAAGSANGSTTVEAARHRPVEQLYPAFECADGFVRIALLSPRQWWAMRRWLGEPEALMGEELDGIHARFAAADLISRYIGALFRHRKMMELVDEAQTRGVPCAPVLSVSDVIGADHYVERTAIAARELAPGIVATVPTGFIDCDGERLGIRTRAPELGEHTSDVLASLSAPHVPAAPISSSRTDRHRLPLDGLRVLDLGIIVYGAEVGRLFADLGADVIKIENRAFPDGGRVARGGAIYPSFAAGHRGKRSVGVNLRSEEGRALFLNLVERSDLVLSNFKPGTLDSLGLGHDTLASVNPAIVTVTSSAMGSSGRWASWMGYGPLIRCATGLSSLWRYPDEPRSFADLTTVYPDHYAARVMATAGMAAIIGRRRTGRGCRVEGAQAEAILMQLADLIALESVEPGAVGCQGNALPGAAPGGVYRCAGDDEWCVITVRTDEEWRRFCAATALADPTDPSLATAQARLARRRELDERVTRWTRRHAPWQVQEILQSAEVPAGAMVRGSELAEDPQLVARQHLTELAQPGLGPITVENAPYLSERIGPLRLGPAPELGQHTREVAAEVLGLGAADIDRLIAQGVLEEDVPVRCA